MTNFITTSEKDTDRDMSNYYKSVFGYNYSTGTCKELFGSNKPDGYDVILSGCKKTIIIIENKDRKTKFMRAKKQILDKYITDEVINSCEDIYCIIGTGNNETFEYVIYKYSAEELTATGLTLEELHCEVLDDDNDEYLKNINPHSINEYIYQNINIPKTDRTLFISFILIVLKIDYQFLEHYKDVPVEIIIDKMFSAIDNQYKDSIFTKNFGFIRNKIYRDHIPQIMKMLSIYMSNNKNANLDILNQFYTEFTVYDKNGEGSLGIVLTPDDIVELMVKELDIKPADSVLDTCTGTGTFLMKSSQYTEHLVGCENNSERYALAKCNFILHDMDYKHLFYDSCFNVEFPVCDKLIINPPFACNCGDDNSSRNDTNWKSFTNEQKFVLYSIQFIRDGGMGTVIIPGINFGNGKQYTCFRKELLRHITPIKTYKCNSQVFYPNATVQCSILVFRKTVNTSITLQLIDYTNDGYKTDKLTRVERTDPVTTTIEKQVDENSNWNYVPIVHDYCPSEKDILIYNARYDCHYSIVQAEYDTEHISPIHYIIDFNLNFKPFVFGDVFEIVKVKTIQLGKTTIGRYPLISSSMIDNGCAKFIDEYNIDGEYLTISYAREPNTGYTSYHNYKFSITSCVGLFRCKMEQYTCSMLHICALSLSRQLNTIFDRSNTINNSSILNVVVYLPCP